MSTALTSTASGSSNTQELRYTLQVSQPELTEPFQRKSGLYLEIELPKGLTVFTPKVKSSELEWNKKFDFTSLQTALIRVKLNKREPFRSDICLGEASISVEELNNRCQGDEDYSLVLVTSPRSTQPVGTILLQLHIKVQTAQLPSNIKGTRQLMENTRSKLVDTYSVEYPEKSRSASANAVSATGGCEDPDGFEMLNRVRNQLNSMKSGKLKTVLGVIDAAAKIHPCVESSWKIISSLHDAYQKKPRMDSQVIRAFASMDHVLSFVEDVDKLKDKEQRFFNLIEQSLRIIEDCGSFIHRYINRNTRDRTLSALYGEEKLSYYQNQLRGLAEDLGRIVNVHVAHRVEDNHNEVMEILERIDGKTSSVQPSSSASFRSIIPPPPTDLFTGREDYLKTVEAAFEFPKTSIETGKQRRFVLYGTGGMGKTQFALKFLDENRERFTIRYIIDASSNESIATSFANIGRDVGIPSADTHKVLDWLSKKIEDWILIFDNADNRDVKLQPYFPNSRHGNILITTRNADYESLAPSLEVSVLDVSSAISLLLRTAQLEEAEENREMARKIVGEFGHLALAIVQAGSYVHTERLTLHEYYERYERSRSTLLKSGPLKEELAYERPVYATWEISYAALSRFAKFVLDLCAFLYREGITEELWIRAVASNKAKRATEREEGDLTAPKELRSLLRYLRLKEDNRDEGVYNMRFREIVRELRSYSLIQEPFRGSFSIHPLVHSWARERMELSHRLEAQSSAIHLLHHSLGPTIYELYLDSGFTRTTIPHIGSCGQPLRADIALEFAGVYAACGRVNDPQIQRLLMTALSERKQFEIGNQHTYNSRNHLAVLYRWLRRYSEAAEILRTLIEEKKRVLGNVHSSTLVSMHCLALMYRDQGRLDDAQELFAKVIEVETRVLGNDHSSTLLSIHQLALTYRDQGRLDDAQELFVEVIEAEKRLLGNDHPSTLLSMHQLASTYRGQGRLDDAQELFVEVIEARKRVLGNDHTSTLLSMHQLALTYRAQGRLDDAQELFVEVIEAEKRLLGNDHSDTLISMHCLASTYRHQGQLEDAQELFVEVVEARKWVLGNDHSETLVSMYELALTYLDRSYFVNAEEMGVEVYERCQRVFGLSDFRTVLSRGLLIDIYTREGRLGDAGRLKTLNSNHAQTS